MRKHNMMSTNPLILLKHHQAQSEACLHSFTRFALITANFPSTFFEPSFCSLRPQYIIII